MTKIKTGGLSKDWSVVVTPKTKLFDFRIKQILTYQDLLKLLIRRDIVVKYKQTVLGPLWLLIQPILTTAMFVIIFSRLAKLSTNNLPPVLFYLSGTVLWTFVADCIRNNSDSFKQNENIFSKVYFPRVVVPIATTGTVFFQFCVQFVLFLCFVIYYYLTGYSFTWNSTLLLLPVLILITALFGLGTGLILSSLTYKYRDFQFLIAFGIQLAMYATPIIYPLSSAPDSLKTILLLNPVTALVEAFRHILLNAGELSWNGLIYSGITSGIIFLLGLLIFNKTERNFMDTV